MTIHEQLKTLNVETSGHYSDLYCPVNEVTEKIISEYKYKNNVTKFINRIDNTIWFDIPFANDDYKRG